MDNNLEQLKEAAVGTETIPNKRTFSPEEKDAMRLAHTDKMILMDAHQEELDAFKKDKGALIKNLAADAKKERKLLKDGFEYQNRECFLIPNHESGKMEYVDAETQEVLFERKLTPDEKQLRIGDMKVA